MTVATVLGDMLNDHLLSGQNVDPLELNNNSPIDGNQVDHHHPQSPRNSRFSRPSDQRPPTTRSIIPDVTSPRDVITASRDLMPSSRDSSVITSPRSDGTIDQTLEIVQALPDKGSKGKQELK